MLDKARPREEMAKKRWLNCLTLALFGAVTLARPTSTSVAAITYVGGSSDGGVSDGVSADGSYSGGTVNTSVTQIGNVRRMR